MSDSLGKWFPNEQTSCPRTVGRSMKMIRGKKEQQEVSELFEGVHMQVDSWSVGLGSEGGGVAG